MWKIIFYQFISINLLLSLNSCENSKNDQLDVDLLNDILDSYIADFGVEYNDVYVLKSFVQFNQLNCDAQRIESIRKELDQSYGELLDKIIKEEERFKLQVIQHVLGPDKYIFQDFDTFWHNKRPLRIHFGPVKLLENKAVLFIGYGINRLDHGVDLILCDLENGKWRIRNKYATYTS